MTKYAHFQMLCPEVEPHANAAKRCRAEHQLATQAPLRCVLGEHGFDTKKVCLQAFGRVDARQLDLKLLAAFLHERNVRRDIFAASRQRIPRMVPHGCVTATLNLHGDHHQWRLPTRYVARRRCRRTTLNPLDDAGKQMERICA